MTDPTGRSQTPGGATNVQFQAVYRGEIAWVVHTLRRLGVPTASLEDVAHDVFVAVHRHLASYDPARPIRPWLFSFAYRMARDHRALAHHRREAGGAPIEHATDPALPADERIDQERRRLLLQAVLAELDFDKRSMVLMHDLEGMTVPAIAEVLGIPVNTAYSRLRLARAEFERTLERLGGLR